MKSRNFFYSLTSIVLTSFLVSVFIVFAADPASPFTPAENVQDPGDTGSAWGGCSPTDPNCYVTFAMPSGAAPTVDSDGEIAYDTTVTDFSTGLIRFFGTEEQGIISLPIAEFTSPSDGDLVSYNATTDEFELVTAAGIPTDSLDYDDFEDTMDLDANLTLNQGSNTWIQNFTGTSTTGLSYVANSLTTGTALSISSSSLSWSASGALVNFSSTSTAALFDLQKVLNISNSGANANAGQTTYGGYFSNTHTGSASENIAMYATSSGGTYNKAFKAVASGGTYAIGISASASGGTNNYAVHSDGPILLGGEFSNNLTIQYLSGPSLSLGAGATQVGSSNSLFSGQNAGLNATNASNSNFLGLGAGSGATNASSSNFLGNSAGYGAINADDSNFFGETAGYQVTAVDDANFFGDEAGYQATSAADSNFFGFRAGKLATNASNSNFLGYVAGENATNASDSTFMGAYAGSGATNADSSVFIGGGAGQNAVDAEFSVFLGSGAGYGTLNFAASYSFFVGSNAGGNAANASNSIFIGERAGENDTVDNTTGGYSILLGPYTDTGNFSNSIAMGRGATNTASNQLVFGSDDTNSSIGTVFFGTGVTATSPVGVVINGSGASGTDIAGASLTLAGGKATGNALGGSLIFQTSDAGASGATLQSLTTKMTLLPSGFFGINDTTPDYRLDIETDVASYVANFFNDGNATTRSGILIQGGLDDHTAVGPSTLIGFQDGDGGAVGSITFGSSATAYNTTSDQRLKDTVNERTESSLDLLNEIQIHDFTWKGDTHNTVYTGVYAQELYDVYPHAVTKPVKDSDNWMVDYSKLTPVIVASIQDLDIKLRDVSDFDDEDNSFGNKLRSWLANAENKITRIFTGEICLTEPGEESVCINRAELQSLKNLLSQPEEDNNQHSNTNSSEEEEPEVVNPGEENTSEENPTEEVVEEVTEDIDVPLEEGVEFEESDPAPAPVEEDPVS